MEGTIVKGAFHVMEAAKFLNTRVVMLSTDAVFGGMKKSSYYDDDVPDPVNEYGRSKYEAEKIILGYGGFVVRTSLVYGFNPMDP
jgi:dTDP-4-dehydrorhamnose reductase